MVRTIFNVEIKESGEIVGKKEKNTPNILFIFPDQHRGDWLPNNIQLDIKMPNLKKIMDKGVTFNRAVTPSPLCAPARACLASGKRYDNCNVSDNLEDYPLEQETFYSILKEIGYSVGGVGKFDLHKATPWWGLDGWVDDFEKLGFTHAIDNAGKMDAVISGKDDPKDPYMNLLHKEGWSNYHVNDMIGRRQKTHYTELSDELYCDNWVGNNAVNMIKNFPKDKPWFIQVNFTGPHTPFDITQSMKKRWENIEFPMPIKWSGEKNKALETRQNYAAMLENIDNNIGRIIKELEEQNELENTIIVYSSDHGEMLGDFDKYGKCRPQKASVNIPMIIKTPGMIEGFESEALVELQDLAATFIDYTTNENVEFQDSISLKPIIERKEKTNREYLYSALKPKQQKKVMHGLDSWRMIEDNEYKLIVENENNYKLYNVEQDKEELRDISKLNNEKVNELLQYLESTH
ncbi:MAG: sulfatase-like hydrolase/transferase [Vallitalea sp.]|jgi:arylsulfatase A-like enzyme|nr:sulfatase-like hydrolase/transferase [Vallitalea sp.]